MSNNITQTSVAGTLMWTKVDPSSPDKDFNDNDVWSTTLIVTKSTAEKWNNAGLTKTIKQDKEGNYILKLKIPCVSRSGKDMKPPVVTHQEGYLVEPEKIGNGSTGTCVVSVIPYDNKFGKGYTTYLKKIIIDNLEEYDGSSEEAEEFSF